MNIKLMLFLVRHFTAIFEVLFNIFVVGIGFYQCFILRTDPIQTYVSVVIAMLAMFYCIHFVGLFSITRPPGMGKDGIPFNENDKPVERILFDVVRSRNATKAICLILENNYPGFLCADWKQIHNEKIKNGTYSVIFVKKKECGILRSEYKDGKWDDSESKKSGIKSKYFVAFDLNSYHKSRELFSEADDIN